MIFKWIGAVLIIAGCTLTGFMISAAYRNEERALQRLIRALDFMYCELQYRQTALPELCRTIGKEHYGCIAKLFLNLADELDSQISPDVQSCLAVAAATAGPLPRRIQEAVSILGSSFGRFDLDGQLTGIESVRLYCNTQLKEMAVGREARLRSYQTLGMCTGAALAILFV